MTGHCSNCGAELFTGQQYCRRCGAPTRRFSTAEVPTQILPEGQAGASAGDGETTRVSARDTDPVYPSRFADRHQPPPGQPAMTAPLDARRPRRRARTAWIVALAAVVLFVGGGAIFLAGYIASGVGRSVSTRPTKIVIDKSKTPGVPAAAVAPDAPPSAGGQALDEEGADVSDDETVITKTFALGEGARVAVTNVAGDISVEGWDEDEAELTVTKRGGTPEERAGVRVLQSRSGDWLRFKTDAGESGRVREVRYELKLPRRLHQLDIVSDDSNVAVSGMESGVGVVVMRGNISVEEAGGTVSTRTTKGNTKVSLASETPPQHLILEGVNGNVELRLKPGTNAELKAETVSGRIEADDSFALRRERRLTGENAVGRLGRGGKAILAKTVSGDIKIRED